MTRLELDDIQGGVLRAYAHLGHAAYVFARVREPSRARATLAGLADPVTSGAEWDVERPPAVTLNVGLSFRALERLGLPAALLRTFPAAFRAGMAARAGELRDRSPAEWQPELRDVEVLLTVHAAGAEALENEVRARRASLDGLDVAHEERGAVLDGDQREHFGFTDGFGQPAVEGVPRDEFRGRGTPVRWRPWMREGPDLLRSRTDPRWGWRAVKAGEFVLGYDDEDGSPPPAPLGPFGRNATFGVWRKLRQDVAAHRAALATEASALGVEPAWLGAKLVGRWADGSPLVLRPEAPDPRLGNEREAVNDFVFASDRDGARCPLGAHVRRANPRDAFGHAGTLTVRHRILRRGMPYGPALPNGAPPDGTERGLVFVCYQADIERQFEVVQRRWMRDGNAFGLGPEPDAVVGEGGGMTIQGRPPDPPRFVSGLGTHVDLRGGEYLWLPGLRGLAALGGQ